MAKLKVDRNAYIQLSSTTRAIGGTEDIGDDLVEVTEQTASLIGHVVGKVATSLRPDLGAIGASKATVKIGAKLGMKNGALTAWVTEVSGEGTIEVSVEFTRA